MAWLGKISNLGNLSDFAGAVNKFSESVKNIERNFDSALGFEARSEPSEALPAAGDKRGQEPLIAPEVVVTKDATENGSSQAEPSLLNNVFGFARANFGNFEKGQSQIPEVGGSANSQSVLKEDFAEAISQSTGEGILSTDNDIEIAAGLQEKLPKEEISHSIPDSNFGKAIVAAEALQHTPFLAPLDTANNLVKHELDIQTISENSENVSASIRSENVSEATTIESGNLTEETTVMQPQGLLSTLNEVEHDEEAAVPVQVVTEDSQQATVFNEEGIEISDRSIASEGQLASDAFVVGTLDVGKGEQDGDNSVILNEIVSDASNETPQKQSEFPNGISSVFGNVPLPTDQILNVSFEPLSDSKEPLSDSKDVQTLKEDLKQMEAALQGAARQSQMKADEISRLMIENEDLKMSLDDLKKKSGSVELDALREEYQQRVGAAERKVYALTKERDLLRREQNRKKDSSVLLKEKDEIIKQVMAEGEELSRKQAVQEGTMRKLRAQIRELEEEKQRMTSKLQVEEGKVESIRKDKAVTEAALQEAVEKSQAELASLREFYTSALNEAKEAQALAEARADSEAKADHERRYLESAEREQTLLQNLDDLRQALSRTEQQAAFREDMHRSELDDLEKRCQAAEARYEELVANMPDSTRPLRRQIEALQESTAARAEAWTSVERALNSRLQDAEAKAAAAQERERAMSERLAQTLSRVAVLEAKLAMLRAEHAQSIRFVEKERQRASESRQDYLAAAELTSTLEGRGKQLEDEFEQMRSRHKEELKEERARCHSLEQEIDQQKAVIADYEMRLRAEGHSIIEKAVIQTQLVPQPEMSSSIKLHNRLPSVSSTSSIEENVMQTPLDSDGTQMQRLSFSDRSPSPYVRGPGVSFEQLKSQLRQKEGELSSCFQRLATLESTRDSLAQELVKVTTQGELLRAEVSLLPGLRAELESLRQRHNSTLELMGERDEEVEELRADLSDVKQMYREQISELVGQIERLSAKIPSS